MKRSKRWENSLRKCTFLWPRRTQKSFGSRCTWETKSEVNNLSDKENPSTKAKMVFRQTKLHSCKLITNTLIDCWKKTSSSRSKSKNRGSPTFKRLSIFSYHLSKVTTVTRSTTRNKSLWLQDWERTALGCKRRFKRHWGFTKLTKFCRIKMHC